MQASNKRGLNGFICFIYADKMMIKSWIKYHLSYHYHYEFEVGVAVRIFRYDKYAVEMRYLTAVFMIYHHKSNEITWLTTWNTGVYFILKALYIIIKWLSFSNMQTGVCTS